MATEHEHHHHITPLRTYMLIFGALMILMILTVWVSFLGLDPGLATLVALAIAGSKAFLIILFFMHVKYSERLVWAFAGFGFFGLLLLLVIMMGDYLARGGIERLEQALIFFV